VRLETLGALVTTGSALFAVLARGSGGAAFPALAGLSVATALSVTQALNWLIRSLSDAETQAISVERLHEYASLPSEEEAAVLGGAPPPVPPPPDWPTHGAITITGLRVKYRPTTPYVLRGVDLELRPREKVGVAGRTGSGKSTLVAALYRLPDVMEGRIEIDGVDIARLPLHALRDALSIIPQDPILFAGSVRSNLDVLREHTDAALWAALALVGMRDAVEAMAGGLEARVAEGGTPFSQGQRQLLAVARALVRRRKIVILDEASSSVDAATDAALQRVMRAELAGSTVITIAHRLNTILTQSDRILVMHDGRVAEFAPPQQLLADPGSALAALAREAGAS
jgi:ATP-binding cassette subfamily C (CFTR/MRP) protein 1